MQGVSQAKLGSSITKPGRPQALQWVRRQKVVGGQSRREGRSHNVDDVYDRGQ